MRSMNVEQYHAQQADCDGRCHVTETMINDNPNLMKCVTCPFCKELVDAVLTETTISCPSCKITVNR